MLMTPILMAFLISVPAPDSKVLDPDGHQPHAVSAPILMSMGPDPGGRTGVNANSDTVTRSQPSTDSATNPNSSSVGNAAARGEGGGAHSQDTRRDGTSSSSSEPSDRAQHAPANLDPASTSR